MPLLELFIIAVGLSMDAFAVSVASGVAIKKMHVRHALLIGGFFGCFQALMPLAGWLAGRWAQSYVAAWSPWIAFGLLAFVGGKMIYEARLVESAESVRDPLNLYVLFMLAIATSIDALAVGVTLSLLGVAILAPILIIGVTTFVLSVAGTYIGDIMGHLFEKKLEILGGLLLIALGLKILLSHLLS